jgi:hypothetical protein
MVPAYSRGRQSQARPIRGDYLPLTLAGYLRPSRFKGVSMADAVARIAKRLDRAAPPPPPEQRWTPAELIARIEAALANRAA